MRTIYINQSRKGGDALLNDLNKCKLFHPAYGEQSLRIDKDEFIEDKTLKQYIRNIERLVRTSPEYKNWLSFVHNVLGTMFFCYHTGESFGTCSIHLHHHPLTLYDYVVIALETTNKFDTFNIAEEVMGYHFCNYVGFVPLCSTTHERYHSGMFNIPIDLVEGNWPNFMKEYEGIIPEYLVDKVTTLSSVTTDNCGEKWYNNELRYVDINTEPTQFTNIVSRANVKKDWGVEDVL